MSSQEAGERSGRRIGVLPRGLERQDEPSYPGPLALAWAGCGAVAACSAADGKTEVGH